jgi:hypothetical protein
MYQVNRLVTAFVVLAFSLLSCQPAPPMPTPNFSLEADLTAASLKPNGKTNIAIQVIGENGFNGDVSLSSVVIESAAKLTSSYVPATTKAKSTLTLSADAASAPGTYTVLVKGSAVIAEKLESRDFSLEITVLAPTTITVAGKVLNAFGQAVSNANVSIASKTPVQTNANGEFEFLEVEKPYTVSVTVGSQVHVFSGLTRANPTLPLLNNTGGAPLTGTNTVAGTLSGGAGFPNPSNHLTQVVFAHPNATTTYTGAIKNVAGLLAGQGGAYSLTSQWTGANSVSGTLYALQWATDPASLTRPTQYKGFGSRAVTLSNGINPAAQNIALAPVNTGNINLALTPSSGTTVTGRGVYVNLDSRAFFVLVNEVTPDTNATYAVPEITGKGLSVGVSATHSSTGTALVQKSGIQAGAAVGLSIPAPALLTSPNNNATLTGLKPTLTYTPVANSVSVVVVSNDVKSTIYYTTATSTSVQLTAAKKYTWAVASLGGYATLDAFTGEDWSSGYPTLGINRDFSLFQSSTRTFNTP